MNRRLPGLLILAASALVLPAAPAQASGLPPVTQPDAVSVTVGSRGVHVNVTANDYDPESEKLFFAGTDGILPYGVGL